MIPRLSADDLMLPMRGPILTDLLRETIRAKHKNLSFTRTEMAEI